MILLDTTAIAVHYNVATGTVRRWACQDGWHPFGTRRHRMWNLWDAQHSYDRRHTRSDQRACA